MRIAIDARELIGAATGVGRYVRELLAAWGRSPAASAHEFILCANRDLAVPPGSPRTCVVASAGGSGTVWQQFVLPRLLRNAEADVLLAPAYTAPLRSPVPVVLSVHDVSFHAHPEWFGWKEGVRLRRLSTLSAGRAARILACSAFTRAELVRHVPAAAGKVEVVYLGITRPPADDGVRSGTQDTDAPPLVLYVGSMFARRHIPELVAGFSQLAGRHPRVRLHLVGENRATPPFDLEAVIRTSPAAARIRAVPYVEDRELAALYGGAAAFVFLSDYEGFGLTPLEALAAGVPIVVLDTPVAREVYGSAAYFVRAPDPALVAEALERVLFDPGERTRILAEAPPVVARYSWDICAARTLELLAAACR